jgi:hypothetical protein
LCSAPGFIRRVKHKSSPGGLLEDEISMAVVAANGGSTTANEDFSVEASAATVILLVDVVVHCLGIVEEREPAIIDTRVVDFLVHPFFGFFSSREALQRRHVLLLSCPAKV